MTIKEALIDTISITLPSGRIDKALIDAELNGASDYTKADEKAVDMVYAGLLLTTIHVTEIKEDDVSIKYTTDLKGIYSAIMRKWNLVDPFLVVVAKPIVRQINFG
ncbi:DUF6706 family protein [Pedobacter nyackensis]|uniref:Uncharacterized protein n=1 Tax=Pedobacter nyackensis TaxID=475255 RepID=A0A1W1ZXV9_9SPHI|nr:DUF6706 family protein [Pedobacter nyackensis]SMC53213.1 hypothetical protein SAMN04488101_101138 [Pedobacter nyackensis]